MLDTVLNFLSHGLTGAGWVSTLIYILVVTQLTIFTVTLYLHRSQTHRGVDFHPALAHFFRFWGWLTTGMVTREWVAVHRKKAPKKIPCLKEMVHMIASLGGYVERPQNEPGAQTIWVGLQRMYDLAWAWEAFGPEAKTARS